MTNLHGRRFVLTHNSYWNMSLSIKSYMHYLKAHILFTRTRESKGAPHVPRIQIVQAIALRTHDAIHLEYRLSLIRGE